MKQIDVRFTDQTVAKIKSLIGHTLTKYRCDPFDYSPSVFGIVGIITDIGSFAVTNMTEVMDYYGANEDVAIFRFEERPEDQINSMVDHTTMMDVLVGQPIRDIRIVNEHQKAYKYPEQTYDVWLTRGLVFVLDNGLEISLEKNVWFSEMITVCRGKRLIETFDSVREFIDDWEPPYRGECERVVI